MGIHHAAMFLWEIVPMWIHVVLGFITGITFPIMAFFVVEGFRRTKNIKRYMLRLLIFATIAQFPYMLAFGQTQLNIIFTIFIALCCLILHKKLCVEKKETGIFVVLFVLINIAATTVSEGGVLAIILIYLFYIIKNEMKRRTIPLVVWGSLNAGLTLMSRLAIVFVRFVEENLGMDIMTGAFAYADVQGAAGWGLMQMTLFTIPIGTFLIIPLLRAYNGELGRRAKYLFYTFYPLHFVIIVIIAYALGLTDLSIAPHWIVLIGEAFMEGFNYGLGNMP